MTILAIAIATNLNRSTNMQLAITELSMLGECRFSQIFAIPCRDAVGAVYWNSACILQSKLSVAEVEAQLKHIEQLSGRTRPSHHSISLDVDVIAWGEQLNQMQLNPKKLPLPDDVLIPLAQLWPNAELKWPKQRYPVIDRFHEIA